MSKGMPCTNDTLLRLTTTFPSQMVTKQRVVVLKEIPGQLLAMAIPEMLVL
jgi:hypothetical protein